jgi:hypothetical protein
LCLARARRSRKREDGCVLRPRARRGARAARRGARAVDAPERNVLPVVLGRRQRIAARHQEEPAAVGRVGVLAEALDALDKLRITAVDEDVENLADAAVGTAIEHQVRCALEACGAVEKEKTETVTARGGAARAWVSARVVNSFLFLVATRARVRSTREFGLYLKKNRGESGIN